MGIHLRSLGTDGGIDVHKAVAFGGDEVDGLAQDNFTVHAVGLCRSVGEVVADIPHVRSAKQGVTDSMQQHVGIAMAEEPLTVFQLNAAHPQLTAFH